MMSVEKKTASGVVAQRWHGIEVNITYLFEDGVRRDGIEVRVAVLPFGGFSFSSVYIL